MSSSPSTPTMHLLTAADVAMMEALLTMFGEAFDEVETYGAARPDHAYLERLLSSDGFLALAALDDGEVVGGIAAYDLPKFEQPRREIFVYDLAVAASHRRQGIATAMLREIQRIAAERGAYLVFVQAERYDAPAVALYSGLGESEEMIHFEIDVPTGERSPTDAEP